VVRSHRTLIGVLLMGSAAALWMPASWTRRLSGLMQWVVPFQEATQAVVDVAAPPDSADRANPSNEETTALLQANVALENQTAAMAVRVEELESQVRLLTASRLWDADGRKLGSRGRLIPAGVVGQDVAAWRSSRMLSAGSWQGVSPGAAVVSRLLTINQGDAAGARSGLAILLGETLVGFIESTATHTCQVKLLSDLSVQMKVRVGQLTGGQFTLQEGYFWLSGAGEGKMLIRDVDRRLIDSRRIQIGDRVLSDSQNEALPAALNIGKITEISPDRDNPLFAILTARSPVAEDALRRVYVFDPEKAEP
jgi:cell shape-determining protein MreC